MKRPPVPIKKIRKRYTGRDGEYLRIGQDIGGFYYLYWHQPREGYESQEGQRIGDSNEYKYVSSSQVPACLKTSWLAYRAASTVQGVAIPRTRARTMMFLSRSSAKQALQLANQALLAIVQWPAWAVSAWDAGWTPPKGWEPNPWLEPDPG